MTTVVSTLRFCHDEPMGDLVATEPALRPIAGPADWRAADLLAEDDWHRSLTEREVAALHDALEHTRRVNPTLDLAPMTAADFPVGTFGETIADLRRRLIDGRGVMAWEAFPAERYDLAEQRAIWWGITPPSRYRRQPVVARRPDR